METARIVHAQVLICQGCCCGRTDRGRPPVPFDWLKAQWKTRKLNKHVQLTLSGCLGPCDLANVVLILAHDQQIWLGGLAEQGHYAALLNWTLTLAATGTLAPLPPELAQRRFTPFTTTPALSSL